MNMYMIMKSSEINGQKEETVISVTDELDVAVFECACYAKGSSEVDTYFHVQDIEGVGGFIHCETEGDEIFLTDGDQKFYLEYDKEIESHEDRLHESVTPDIIDSIIAVNIRMSGSEIGILGLSEELMDEISSASFTLGEFLTKNEMI